MEEVTMDVRGKLIEIVKKAAYSSLPSNTEDFHLNMFVTNLLAHGVTVQEWITASEPPKKITNKVIVLCKNGYRGFGHYEDYKGKQTWYNLESGKPFTDWDLEDCESYEVTHWMPLPHLPKGWNMR